MSIGLNVVAAAMIWALVVYYLLVGWVLRFPGKYILQIFRLRRIR